MKIKQHMHNVYLYFVLDRQVNRLYLMGDVQEKLFQLEVQIHLDGIRYFNRIMIKDKKERKHLQKWIKKKKIELVIEVDHFN